MRGGAALHLLRAARGKLAVLGLWKALLAWFKLVENNLSVFYIGFTRKGDGGGRAKEQGGIVGLKSTSNLQFKITFRILKFHTYQN